MRRSALAAVFLFIAVGCQSVHAPPLREGSTLRLWQGAAPGAQGNLPADIPQLAVFLPDKPNGAAMIVCPGGGYGHIADVKEGIPTAHFLTRRGVTVFLLRYRLGPKYHHPIELHDAQRAIRFVRAHADAWHLKPDRIGIMGYSAGGHLASSTATHFDAGNPSASDPIDRVSSRPDIQVLIYPVITMEAGGHKGSRINLLGADAPQSLIDFMSSERQVTDQTPPAFVMQSTADRTVKVVPNADAYVAALKAHHVPVEYIRGDLGPHGTGPRETWLPQLGAWLTAEGFATPQPASAPASGQ